MDKMTERHRKKTNCERRGEWGDRGGQKEIKITEAWLLNTVETCSQ